MFESRLNRGKAHGYTPLDSTKKVPLENLPPFQSPIDTGSITAGNVTASVHLNEDIFLIRSGSNTFFTINENSNTTISSNLFIIKNHNTGDNILTVSQSIVQFATQSFDPTGSTQAGSIWFTSSSMYVGLE